MTYPPKHVLGWRLKRIVYDNGASELAATKRGFTLTGPNVEILRQKIGEFETARYFEGRRIRPRTLIMTSSLGALVALLASVAGFACGRVALDRQARIQLTIERHERILLNAIQRVERLERPREISRKP